MRKRTLIGGLSAIVLVASIVGGHGDQSKSSSVTTQPTAASTTTVKAAPEKTIPVCDGTTTTTSCTVDGVTYATYIYHPAVAQKTHTETVTTYQQKVTGYCTLCVDNTYSPSCATGRGACSYHGGVAEWNAPRYSSVPENTTKTVVDAPAQDAYYEKVVQ